jgi:hypothetical protein
MLPDGTFVTLPAVPLSGKSGGDKLHHGGHGLRVIHMHNKMNDAFGIPQHP